MWLVSFFIATKVGRAILALLVAAVAFFSWMAVHDHKVKEKAVEQVQEQIHTQAVHKHEVAKRNKATVVRRSTSNSGWLRDTDDGYRRD